MDIFGTSKRRLLRGSLVALLELLYECDFDPEKLSLAAIPLLGGLGIDREIYDTSAQLDFHWSHQQASIITLGGEGATVRQIKINLVRYHHPTETSWLVEVRPIDGEGVMLAPHDFALVDIVRDIIDRSEAGKALV